MTDHKPLSLAERLTDAALYGDAIQYDDALQTDGECGLPIYATVKASIETVLAEYGITELLPVVPPDPQ